MCGTRLVHPVGTRSIFHLAAHTQRPLATAIGKAFPATRAEARRFHQPNAEIVNAYLVWPAVGIGLALINHWYAKVIYTLFIHSALFVRLALKKHHDALAIDALPVGSTICVTLTMHYTWGIHGNKLRLCNSYSF
ncbi:MAG: hypothetical protein BA863_05100 [Desulfovibrio sp. S3730MH75]|nr:MAG: hypothetical protein BA863_05100 [Desulfovibrio sp. S3730MH75]